MDSPWLIRWAPGLEPEPTLAQNQERELASIARRSDGSFVAFEGYLFEQARLRTELGLDPEADEAAILVAAFREWGSECLDDLRGGYQIAVWDWATRELLVVRDATGLWSSYYWWDEKRLLVASSQQSILAQEGMNPEFHRPAIAEYLHGAMGPRMADETFYRDLYRLRPAHCLRLKEGKLETFRYWEPLPSSFEWADEEELRTFPERLQQALNRCLEVGADSLGLSGGFDSVTLAVLAAQQRDGEEKLTAVSLRFDASDCDEGETQSAVAKKLGMPQVMRGMKESLAGFDPVKAALEFSDRIPTPVLSVWQSMYTGLLQIAADRGCRRLLLGTGGDDLLTVDVAYGADCLRSLRLSKLWSFYRAWQRSSSLSARRVAVEVFWKGAARPLSLSAASSLLGTSAPGPKERLRRRRWQDRLDSRLGIPRDGEVRDAMSERYFASPEQNRISRGRYPRMLSRLLQSPILLMELDQGFAWARSLDFTLLFPYFDRDVAELTLRMHPEHLIAGGWSKAPLRRLVADELPDVPMRKTKVDFGHMVHEVLRPCGIGPWRTMRPSLTIEALGLVDADRVRELVDGYFDGRNNQWLPVWLILSTEAWLLCRTA